MDWKTRHPGLSTDEAKAQILAISQETGPSFFTVNNPFRAVAIALAAGFLAAKAAPVLRWAGKNIWSVASQFVVPQSTPQSSVLERMRERTYRRSRR